MSHRLFGLFAFVLLPASAVAQVPGRALDSESAWLGVRAGPFLPTTKLDVVYVNEWSEFHPAWTIGLDAGVPLRRRIALQVQLAYARPQVWSEYQPVMTAPQHWGWPPNQNHVLLGTASLLYAPHVVIAGIRPYASAGLGVKSYMFDAMSGGDVIFPFASGQTAPSVALAAGVRVPAGPLRLVLEGRSVASRFTRYPEHPDWTDHSSTSWQNDVLLSAGVDVPVRVGAAVKNTDGDADPRRKGGAMGGVAGALTGALGMKAICNGTSHRSECWHAAIGSGLAGAAGGVVVGAVVGSLIPK